jgi:predicted O-linked N-acetylglucosamine transferase (SPINDLY family)
MAYIDPLARATQLQSAGRYPEAARLCKEVLTREPGNARAFLTLGDLFRSLENYSAAESSYRQALERDPALFAAQNNLGNVLRMVGRLGEAECWYRAALRLRPTSTVTLTNLGLCLTEQGRIAEARTTYGRVLTVDPLLAPARSDYLMCLCYDTTIDPHAMLEEHREWDRHCGMRHRKDEIGWKRVRIGSRLRVGYVSPDFRAHSVAYFVEPLLAEHDRDAFDVYVYADVAVPDATTARLRGYPLLWRDTRGMGDEEMAALIARDRIDILVDLAGHTAGNRLGVFCRGPAPVQVTYCGYPATTGLEAMKYRLTDAVADPPGEDEYYSEQLVRLDGCFLCYRPPACAPLPAPSPAGSGRAITLGSFNALPKINDGVIELWARVLEAIPGSRLLLKNKSLTDRELRAALIRRFTEAGAGADRIETMGYIGSTEEHLSLYHGVDIALDTFPYNGTTTTCEALWMGVPVVTRAGGRHVERVGASLLEAVGLPELVVSTDGAYIEAVRALAADHRRLRALRRDLRSRMAVSVLCDAEGFTRRVEAAYRTMCHTVRESEGNG